MTPPDPYPSGDAERDMLTAGIQRTEAAVSELASRLDVLAADVGELRRQRSQDDGASLRAALMGAIEEVRVELRHACLEMAEQAARHAERAAAGVAESSAEALAEALGQSRAELVSGLESVQRLALASGERAAHALAEVASLQQRDQDVDALRAGLASLRDEILRRVGEAEAHFGVRLDAVAAGVEAEARAVRDALWDRVAGAEQRLQDAEAMLASVRAELPRAASDALDGLAIVQSGLDDLRDGLAAASARLTAIESARGGRAGAVGGMVTCVRDELVAVVMAVVSVGMVVGRLALSLVR